MFQNNGVTRSLDLRMVEVGCFRSAFCSHGIRVVNFVFVIVFLDPGAMVAL